MRGVVLFFCVIYYVFGALNISTDDKVQLHIVRSLDLPESFIHTKRFRDFAKKYDIYKKIHLFNPKEIQTYFVPDLVRIIDAQNVPDVFLYMAMVESRFATHARSRKKAVGIWQLIPETARRLGLHIDHFVDERRDPYKSTNAAITYLKTLHAMFGKWYLAALAYNAGPGAVKRAIERAKTDDIFVLLDPKKRYLPKESRLYLYKIVMLALMANSSEYLLSHDLEYIMARDEDCDIMPIQVQGGSYLGDIADAIGVRYSFLKKLNPHLRHAITPPYASKYFVYIPRIKYFAFAKNYKPHPFKGVVSHTVRKGESLYLLAHRYGVSIKTIMRYNALSSARIRIGQKLLIPLFHMKKYHIARRHIKKIYRVKKGDTLYTIARRFGVATKKLRAWNDKKSDIVKIGEKLVVLQYSCYYCVYSFSCLGLFK